MVLVDTVSLDLLLNALISLEMEKIVEEASDSLKNSAGESFKDEFLKAQKNILGKFPTPEHLKNLINQLKDLTEEEKEKLMKNIADRANTAEKFKDLFSKKNKIEVSYLDYVVFVGVVLLIIAVFGENFLDVISKVRLRPV